MQKESPLPYGAVAFLSLASFLGMMTSTMFLAYQPKLLRHFHISEVDIGYHAALLTSAFYLAKTIFAVCWGMLSDTIGRKETVLLTAASMGVSTILFGFSTTFVWALTTRFFQGISFAILSSSKAYASEICDQTNVIIRAISVLMAAMSFAFIVGPTFSFDFMWFGVTSIYDILYFHIWHFLLPSFLVFPSEQYPSVFPESGIFYRFPILLPNLFIGISLLVLVVTGAIYLPKSTSLKTIEETTKKISIKDRILNSKLRQLLSNKLAMCSCGLYAWSAYNGVAVSEMFPLYTSTTPVYKGLDFTPRQIGLTFFAISFTTTFGQLVCFPMIIKKFGPEMTYIVFVSAMAVFIPTLPLAGLCLNNRTLLWFIVVMYLLVVRNGISISMLASNVMFIKSVPKTELGIVNGFGFSLGGFTRMIAASSFPSLYSWSLTNIKGIATNLHPLDFPFNQYFVFILLSFSAVLSVILASCVFHSVKR